MDKVEPMQVTVLGSGTSSGVPMIGCQCSVCTSDNPRNRRTRSSIVVEVDNKMFLIDTSTDLHEQALNHGLHRVDAVLYTHAHADHVHGIDELRAFNLWQRMPIPCYGNHAVGDKIRNYFKYIFNQSESESFRPHLDFYQVDGVFDLFGTTIIPVPLLHGKMPVLGYRIGTFAYLTDVSEIPEGSWKLIENLDCVVLDALRQRPHPTHFNISQAVEVVGRLKPERAILTHLSHLIEYDEVSKNLPKGTELAYDGMVFAL